MVARVRRVARERRIGHTGTLDPFASGLLVLVVGRGTRLSAFVCEYEKEYRVRGRLGVVTDTRDRTGKIVGGSDPAGVEEAALVASLAPFRGEILQTPPLFSARKVAGRRLHEIAREGGEVALLPVRVRIDRLDLMAFEPPEFVLDVRCSKGTYVRSLVHDLGLVLGCGATAVELARTAVGPFRLQDAARLEDFRDEESVRARLLPLASALPDWPVAWVTTEGALEIRQGRPLRPGMTAREEGVAPGLRVRVLAPSGELLALAWWEAGGDVLARPFRVFPC